MNANNELFYKVLWHISPIFIDQTIQCFHKKWMTSFGTRTLLLSEKLLLHLWPCIAQVTRHYKEVSLALTVKEQLTTRSKVKGCFATYVVWIPRKRELCKTKITSVWRSIFMSVLWKCISTSLTILATFMTKFAYLNQFRFITKVQMFLV